MLYKIFVEGYGCSSNISFTRSIQKLLSERGFQIVGTPKGADFAIINTCTVKTETEQRLLRRIGEIADLCKTIVTGCMADAQPGLIKTNFPDVSIVSLSLMNKMPELVLSEVPIILIDKNGTPPLIPEIVGRRLIIPISRGCVGHCTYCIVKNALGTLRSYPSQNIIDCVKYALGKDFVELFITAQDTAIYGKDLSGDTDLFGLLRSILSLEGNFMMRIGMMTPNHAWEIREGLVDILRDERVYQFIHLPLQSGDDKILRAMGRQYDSGSFIRLVKYFREKLPGLCVVTDVIVGFPGEGNDSFEKTIKVLQAIEPEKVNISRFTPRPHTLAKGLPQVKDSIKRSRSKQMTEICRTISITKKRQLVGKTLKAIPLRKRGKFFYGRSSSFIPIVFEQNEFLHVGHIYKTYVTGTGENGIRGKTILESESS